MPPSPFVIQWAALAGRTARPAARALDLAIGGGRHVDALTRAGFKVFGVDRSLTALVEARRAAPPARLALWCADLTRAALPPRWFDLVLVTRYLDRRRFDALRETVVPGGIVIYETFTIHQRELGWGPTSPEHLLEPGELRAAFEGFDVLHDEEVRDPEAVARLVARRPGA